MIMTEKSLEELANQALKYKDQEAADAILALFPLAKGEKSEWILTLDTSEQNMKDLLFLIPHLQLHPKSQIASALAIIHLQCFDVKLPAWSTSRIEYMRYLSMQFSKWQTMQQSAVDRLLSGVSEVDHHIAVDMIRCCRGRHLLTGLRKLGLDLSTRSGIEKKQMHGVMVLILEAVKGSVSEHEYIEQGLLFEQYYLEDDSFDLDSEPIDDIPWLTEKHLATYLSKLKHHTLLKPYITFALRPLLGKLDDDNLKSLGSIVSGRLSADDIKFASESAIGLLCSLLVDLITASRSDSMFTQATAAVRQLSAIGHQSTVGVVRWLMARLAKRYKIDFVIEDALADGWQWKFRKPELESGPSKENIGNSDEVAQFKRMSEDQNQESSQSEDEEIGFDCLEGTEEETSYKHLYQCLLAFQSDDPTRVLTSLTSLPAAIINNISYLPSIAGDLISSLLLLNQPTDGFSSKKSRALLFLLLCAPSAFKELFINRFYKGDCSLGERIAMLQTMNSAIWRIMTNANERSLVSSVVDACDNLDFDGDIGSTQSGRQRPMIQIVGEDESALDNARQIRDSRVEHNSRRWGYARIAHEARLAQEDSKIRAFQIVEEKFEDKVVKQLTPLYLLVFTDLMQYAK